MPVCIQTVLTARGRMVIARSAAERRHCEALSAEAIVASAGRLPRLVEPPHMDCLATWRVEGAPIGGEAAVESAGGDARRRYTLPVRAHCCRAA